jgi:hypothetical protein
LKEKGKMTELSKPSNKFEQRLRNIFKGGRPKLVDVLLAIGIVTFGAAIAFYAYLGFFSRYYADDYCMTAGLLKDGFWKSQISLYNIWSPAFSGTFLQYLSEYFGRSAIQVWPSLLIVLWVLTLSWAVVQAIRVTRLKVPVSLVLLLAEAVVFFSILESPQRYQTIYWRIGLVGYTLPLVFLSLLIGLIFNRFKKADPIQIPWRSMVLCAVLAYFSGGFSITYVTLQTGMLGLALAGVWLTIRPPSRRNSLFMVGAALAGSLVALLVVALAPGNAIRMALMPARPHLLPFIRMAVTNSVIFIYLTLKSYAFQNVLAVLVPMLITYLFYGSGNGIPRMRPSSLVTVLFLIPVISFLLVLAVVAPSVYAESSYPEGRVLMEARFIMVFMTIAEGALIGMSLSQLHQWAQEPAPRLHRLFAGALFLSLSLYPLYDARKSYMEIPFYQNRAATWDAHNAFIRANLQLGKLDVNILDSQARSFDDFSGLSDLTSDPGNWVNQCAASFYGLHQLTVNQP